MARATRVANQRVEDSRCDDAEKAVDETNLLKHHGLCRFLSWVLFFPDTNPITEFEGTEVSWVPPLSLIYVYASHVPADASRIP
jgi:hypothetical protein